MGSVWIGGEEGWHPPLDTPGEIPAKPKFGIFRGFYPCSGWSPLIPMENCLAYVMCLALTCFDSCIFLAWFIGCGCSWNPALRDLFPGCFRAVFRVVFRDCFQLIVRVGELTATFQLFYGVELGGGDCGLWTARTEGSDFPGTVKTYLKTTLTLNRV